jgi:hypothetical protein
LGIVSSIASQPYPQEHRRGTSGKLIAIMLLIVMVAIQASTILPQGHNLAREPYRSQERRAARKAWVDNPSPATKAIFEEEQRRVRRYVYHRDAVRFASWMPVILVLDGLAIYCFWNYRKIRILHLRSRTASEEPVECLECHAIIPIGESRCSHCGWTFNT